MKIPPSVYFGRRLAVALTLSLAALAATSLNAQTVFTATGLAGSVALTSSNVSATNFDALYNNTGTTTNNITGVTFGNGFTMTDSSGTGGNYDNTFIIGGTISGDSILAGTSIGISYNFTLAKNLGVNSDAIWNLKFSDSINNPSGAVGTSTLVASGTLSSASNTFTGAGNYAFVTGVGASDTFRVFLEVTYSGELALMPPVIDGTMSNTGFGGGGITIGASAVPEPSTYAMFAGLGVLGFAAWRRRGAKLALAG